MESCFPWKVLVTPGHPLQSKEAPQKQSRRCHCPSKPCWYPTVLPQQFLHPWITEGLPCNWRAPAHRTSSKNFSALPDQALFKRGVPESQTHPLVLSVTAVSLNTGTLKGASKPQLRADSWGLGGVSGVLFAPSGHLFSILLSILLVLYPAQSSFCSLTMLHTALDV